MIVKNIKESYRAVFSTPEGKEVLAHICKNAHLTSCTFVKKDPNETLINEGMRRLALSILRYAGRSDRDIIEQIEKEFTDA